MSAETDRHDQATLAAIGRNPGCKRTDSFVNAAVTRLLRAGLVEPPSTNGKLDLTQAGKDRRNGNTITHYTDPFTRPVPTLAQVTEATARAVDEAGGWQA